MFFCIDFVCVFFFEKKIVVCLNEFLMILNNNNGNIDLRFNFKGENYFFKIVVKFSCFWLILYKKLNYFKFYG